MKKLIITSPSDDSRGIYILDTSTGEFDILHSEQMCPMGITKYNDKYLVADRFEGVYILDNDFKILANYPYAGKDLHDIIIVDDLFFVTETYSNRINIFTIEDGKFVGDIRPFDKPVNRHHLNSFKIHNGKIYASVFCLSGSEHYKDNAKDGAIVEINLSTGKIEKIIIDNLFQPHTICFVGEDMYFCESLKMKVYKNSKDNLVTQSVKYTRGLALDDKYLYIGESRDRHAFNHSQNKVPDSVRGSLLIHDIETEQNTRIKLPLHEIYDILIL